MTNDHSRTTADTHEHQRHIEFTRWCRARAEENPWTDDEKAELRHVDEIMRLRRSLTRELNHIRSRIDRAQSIIGELRSPRVYDVEFEGESDTEARLADARRAISAAVEANPDRSAEQAHQQHTLQQRMSAIAAQLTPCPQPTHDTTVCQHNEPWPCAITKTAWIARGWDIDEETWRAAPENLAPF
ncbi:MULTISPECIES: hypothetical protein [Nocardia]|uniref:hypothetical protein n=1 Tax=Nocardia TaxID=1817 RepID=UPI0024558050|nr:MULTISPECIES: hypothetical protein [Nocardia]